MDISCPNHPELVRSDQPPLDCNPATWLDSRLACDRSHRPAMEFLPGPAPTPRRSLRGFSAALAIGPRLQQCEWRVMTRMRGGSAHREPHPQVLFVSQSSLAVPVSPSLPPCQPICRFFTPRDPQSGEACKKKSHPLQRYPGDQSTNPSFPLFLFVPPQPRFILSSSHLRISSAGSCSETCFPRVFWS